MSEEKKGAGIEKKIAELKRLAEKAENARLELEKAAQEARKEAEIYIPKIKAEMDTIDKEITEAQQKKASLMEQLKLLGEKVKVRGAGKARGGGMREKFHELLRKVGVGATITNEDINDFLGSSSGYVGMIIGWEIEAGNIQRIEAGKFKVTGVP
jgi:uncharacterized coiled-coil DUF342 family protein